MRRAFADFLISRAQRDDRIFFLTGDLGFQVFDEFKERFPERYLNVGIAEANMVGIAAGLAQQGFKPFCYSIASFLIPRAYEQIRFFSGYNGYKTVYVGAGGGFAYGESGATHHSLDDIGLAQLIPGLDIYVPSGPSSLTLSLEQSMTSINSSYIQIGKFGEKDVNSSLDAFPCKTLIITYGPVATETEIAVAQIKQKANILVLNRIKPFPSDLVSQNLRGIRRVMLVEEQFESSGILLELLQCLNRFDSQIKCTRLGAQSKYSHEVQDSSSLRNSHGFDSANIVSYFEVNGRS
jgi:transketolase